MNYVNGYPEPPYPSEVELARQYFAQLDPTTVSADEYADAMFAAGFSRIPKGFGFPETEVEDEVEDE